MEQKRGNSWLGLAQAADFLGVHYTTVRRWADDDQLPYIRTPGGHRRFQRSDLEAFLDRQQQGTETSACNQPHSSHALALAPRQQMGVQHEPWYGRLDEVQRTAMRADGQQLMAVLMQYATRTNGGELFLAEGERLAVHYGQICHAVGLSLVETVRGFTLMRRAISDSVYQAGSLAGPPDAETWRLYNRTNHFLDTMLITIMDAYIQQAGIHT